MIITVSSLLLSCLIGALYYEITSIINILGGFCSVVIAFLFPGWLYVKNSEYPITHYKNMVTIILVVVLCIIGFTAGILTVMDAFI